MVLPLLQQPNPKLQPLRRAGVMLRGWPWRFLAALSTLALLLAALLVTYRVTARPATLLVDGTSLTVRTHHRLVGAVLAQANVALSPGDEVSPNPDFPWDPAQAIVVRRAFPVIVQADGRELCFRGRPRSLLEVLAYSNVSLDPGDVLSVNSERVPESAYADERALQSLLHAAAGTPYRAVAMPPVPSLHVQVVRAVPLFVHDDGLDIELRTTAATLGQALEEAGLRLFRADRIYPALDTPVGAGLHVTIDRATPVSIQVDGRSYVTRTRADTVAALLREEGIGYGPMDRLEPLPETAVGPGLSVRIVRVTTLDLAAQEPIPYRKLQEPDPSRELDDCYLRPGKEGIKERITRVTFEDGRQVGRRSLGERVTLDPVDQILYYGTRIVIRTLDTPDGRIEYWRRFRVLATHYYPSTCDKTPDDPEYGITYTGKRATRGIIAVDPRVIPLHTRLYVPGYGFGAAEDIGGAIKGRHIDVCFDDADQGKGLWDTRYVDVYLLLPIPDKFPWVLP